MASNIYIYSISQLTNSISPQIYFAVNLAIKEIIEELRRIISSDVYGSEINKDYEPTYEFLDAFAFSEIIKQGDYVISSLTYNADEVIMQSIEDGWNIHGSVLDGDVSSDLWEILNVDGKTSPIGIKIRKPYLNNFKRYLENNFDDIMKRALIKSGFPIS